MHTRLEGKNLMFDDFPAGQRKSKLGVVESCPLVSIIVLNWNGADYIGKCLSSLQKTQYSNFEVIVVDNASRDGSPHLIRSKFPEVRLIINHSNLGFSRGNNIGIRCAKGDIIVLLNNDVEVDPNWLSEIVSVFSMDSKIGIVGCILCYLGTDVIQFAGGYLHPAGHCIVPDHGQRLSKLKNKIAWEVDYVTGAALAIKKEVIKKIGLLDPKFFAYCEDVEWCFRAKKAGYKVVMCRGIVYHYGSFSWGKYLFKKTYLNEANRILFLKKHFKGLDFIKRVFFHEVAFWIFKIRCLFQGSLETQKLRKTINYSNGSLNLLQSILNLMGVKLILFIKILLGKL